MPRTADALLVTALLVTALLGGAVLAGCSTSPVPDPDDAPDAVFTPIADPPPAHAVVDYQLGGAYDPEPDVQVVSRDRTAEPASGLYSICYVNAFQTQPDEDDFWTGEHPELVLRDGSGAPVEDANWPGEYLLDTSTEAHRTALAEIVGGWVDGCADAGFQAVEPDNLDSASRSGGALTMADAYAFAALLADRAHARGLAFAQKNTAETTPEQAAEVGFDFAVAESCEVFDECDDYTAVHGNRVIEIEYTEDGRQNFLDACAARGDRVSVLYRDRDVAPRGGDGYTFEHC